jgi:hypothetical protein
MKNIEISDKISGETLEIKGLKKLVVESPKKYKDSFNIKLINSNYSYLILNSDLMSANFTIEGMKKYNVVKTIYFCIARRAKGGVKELIFFPYNYSLIDIPNITITESTDKKILFNDGKDKYNFNFSKSTLYQYFSAPEDAKIISFEVYPDPWLKLITPETQTD